MIAYNQSFLIFINCLLCRIVEREGDPQWGVWEYGLTVLCCEWAHNLVGPPAFMWEIWWVILTSCSFYLEKYIWRAKHNASTCHNTQCWVHFLWGWINRSSFLKELCLMSIIFLTYFRFDTKSSKQSPKWVWEKLKKSIYQDNFYAMPSGYICGRKMC